jgi:hypothetical protein
MQSEIAKIIDEQPDPSFFYKSLLELDVVNIVSIVSFDSKCIAALLDEKNSKYFTPKYPMFYKIDDDASMNTSISKDVFFKSAIDIAIYNNQIAGISAIL